MPIDMIMPQTLADSTSQSSSSKQTEIHPHTIHINNKPAATADAPLVSVSSSSSSSLLAVRPAWSLSPAQYECAVDELADDLLDYCEQLDYDTWIDNFEQREQQRQEKEKQSTERTRNKTQADTHKQSIDAEHKQQQQQQEREPLTASNSEHQQQLEQKEKETETETDADFFPVIHAVPLCPSTSDTEAAAQPDPYTSKDASRERPSSDQSQKTTENSTTESASESSLSAVLLSSSSSLRSIHSPASLRVLVEREKVKLGSTASTMHSVNSMSVPIPAPVVTVVKERTACNAQIHPNNLPYLYRHPAV